MTFNIKISWSLPSIFLFLDPSEHTIRVITNLNVLRWETKWCFFMTFLERSRSNMPILFLLNSIKLWFRTSKNLIILDFFFYFLAYKIEKRQYTDGQMIMVISTTNALKRISTKKDIGPIPFILMILSALVSTATYFSYNTFFTYT